MLTKQMIYLRKRLNLSQAELAKSLNISASTVGMYEQGRRVPNVDMLVRLSTVFDVSLDYLITGSEHIHSGAGKRPAVDCPCTTCCWKNGNI